MPPSSKSTIRSESKIRHGGKSVTSEQRTLGELGLASRNDSLLMTRRQFGLSIDNPRFNPLAWSVLREEDINQLATMSTVDQLADALGQKFGIPNKKDDALAQLTLSQIIYAYMYAQKLGLSPIQTSTYVSMSKVLFDHPGEKDLEGAAETLKVILSNHTKVSHPELNPKQLREEPGSPNWEVFPADNIPALYTALKYGSLQHYRLYQTIYNTEQERANLEILSDYELPFEVFDMAQGGALPIDEWQARNEAERARVEAERLEAARQAEQARLITQNIFKELDADRIKTVAAEIVGTMLAGLVQEVEGQLDIQRQKFVNAASKELASASITPPSNNS